MKKAYEFQPYRDLSLCIICLFLAFLLTMAGGRKQDEALAARVAPEILRFHVLANSDSDEDQSLKLHVRTYLLDLIYEELGENASLEDTKAYILKQTDHLEQAAENYMLEQGYDYPAKLALTNSYFPTKTYGDMVFPCGQYDAVKVTIGAGKGHNWWCVLYPPLCFVDSTYAVVPDTSKALLERALGQDDYDSLLLAPASRNTSAQHRVSQDKTSQQKESAPQIKVRVRFKLPELLRQKSGS